MRKVAVKLATAVAIGGLSTLMFCEFAAAARMTRDQARIACRNEVPHVSKGDRGNSRGFNSTVNPAMRECVRAKMSGK